MTKINDLPTITLGTIVKTDTLFKGMSLKSLYDGRYGQLYESPQGDLFVVEEEDDLEY